MNENILHIPLNDIEVVSNTRSGFNENKLKELALSIKTNGVIQPVAVKPSGNGKYQLICGERRFRASLLAGKSDIPARVIDLPDHKILQFQIVENLQRDSVSVMDEVRAINKMVKELGMTEQEVGKAIGKSNSHIFNQLLIGKSAIEVQEALEKNQLYRQVALVISKLDPDKQVIAVNALKRDNPGHLVKAKEAETWINNRFGVAPKKAQTGRFTPKNIASRFASDWKYYFVRFNATQFEQWQEIVRNRTDFETWSEAVEVVMRQHPGKVNAAA